MQLLECYFYFLIRISSPATFILELFLFLNFKLASCYVYSKGYFYFLSCFYWASASTVLQKHHGKVNGVFQTYFTLFQEQEVIDLPDFGQRVEAPLEIVQGLRKYYQFK